MLSFHAKQIIWINHNTNIKETCQSLTNIKNNQCRLKEFKRHVLFFGKLTSRGHALRQRARKSPFHFPPLTRYILCINPRAACRIIMFHSLVHGHDLQESNKRANLGEIFAIFFAISRSSPVHP